MVATLCIVGAAALALFQGFGDSDTIGLIVLLVAVAAVLIAGKIQEERKKGPRARDRRTVAQKRSGPGAG